MRRLGLVAAGVALAAWTAACGGSSSSSSDTTTSPSSTATVETFTGSVAVKGSDSHNFTVTNLGVVSVTLSTTTPSGVSVGLGIGQPVGDLCSTLPGATTTASAGSAAQLSGTLSAGTFCVKVYDTGSLTTATSYSLTVSHY